VFEFAMPSLGADMETGTVLAWYVGPGDVVKRGDIVALVDTEKAEIEVEIWNAGRIERILVEPGREVPVGTPLLTLDEQTAAGATRPESGGKPPTIPIPPQSARPAPSAKTPSSPPSAASSRPRPPSRPMPLPAAAPPHVDGAPSGERRERVRATPLARRLARELALDLGRLSGSGPAGRVRADDVRAAATSAAAKAMNASARTTAPTARQAEPTAPAAPMAAPVSAEKPLSTERLAAIQRGMAAAMARSKREIPHFYLDADLDMSRALAWLEVANRGRSVEERLILQVLLLKATARALADVPELNGHWRNDRFEPADRIHLGVGITVRGGGLLAPALHDVDRKDLGELMHDLSDLVARARRAQLRSSEVQDATATVTSLADRGPDRVFGVIYPPQVALVGFGGLRERPWAEAGMLGVRPTLSVTLSADHRATHGQCGARLLRRIAEGLQEPEKLA
jgi:pyruvate dehydrogenase E2 component (dihydrolipoamide acetyltransferase)